VEVARRRPRSSTRKLAATERPVYIARLQSDLVFSIVGHDLNRIK